MELLRYVSWPSFRYRIGIIDFRLSVEKRLIVLNSFTKHSWSESKAITLVLEMYYYQWSRWASWPGVQDDFMCIGICCCFFRGIININIQRGWICFLEYIYTPYGKWINSENIEWDIISQWVTNNVIYIYIVWGTMFVWI